MSQPKPEIMLTNKNPADWVRHMKNEVPQKVPATAKPLFEGKHPDPDVDPDYSIKKNVVDPNNLLAEADFAIHKQQVGRNLRDYKSARQQATSHVIAAVSPEILFTAQNCTEYKKLVADFDYIGLIDFFFNHALGPRACQMYYEALKGIMNAGMHRDEPSATYFRRVVELYRRVQDYSRDNTKMDPSIEEAMAQAIVRGLGPQFKNFVEDTLPRFVRKGNPLTVNQVIEEARSWESTVAAKTQQSSVPTHTAMLGEQTRCRICGGDHDKSECTVENPFCSTCKAEGRAMRIYKGHTTAGHLGPRQQRFKGKAKPKGKPKVLVATDYEEDNSCEDESDEVMLAAFVTEGHEDRMTPLHAQPAADKKHAPPPETLHRNQYDILRVPGDGHCMYRACALSAGLAANHMVLRDFCADLMDQQPDLVLRYGTTLVEEVALLNQGLSYQEVIAAVRHSQYGGELELHLLEMTLGIGFAVYSPQDDGSLKLWRAPAPGHYDRCHYLLLTLGRTEAGNHYDALRMNMASHLAPQRNTARTYAQVARGLQHYVTTPQAGPAQMPRSSPSRLASASPSGAYAESSSCSATLERTRDEVQAVGTPVVLALAARSTPIQTPGTQATSKGRKARKGRRNVAVTHSSATEDMGSPSPPDVRFHLDSGATTHLLHPSVPLTGTEATPTRIQGVGGSVTATTVGVHRTLGRAVVYESGSRRSLISLSKLAKSHALRYDPTSNSFTATRNGITMTFHEVNGLYTLSNPETVFTLTEDIPAQLLRRYQAVLSLHQRLNHPSDGVLAKTIASGSIPSPGCAPDDIRKAREHFGPCPACLAGKNTQDVAKPSESPPPPFASSLHVDIAFVHAGRSRKSPFLIGVEESTSVAAAAALEDRTAASIGRALNQMIDQFDLLSGAKIREVRTDPEQGLLSTRNALAARGVRLVVVPAERHVRLAERVIRELKNYMRSTLAGLTYRLPLSLYPYLLMDVVATRNVVSHRGNLKCPRELLTGDRPQLDRDIKHAFGAVGHTRVTGLDDKDDMHPRTELSIVVGHYLGEAGAVMVWLPRSNRVVKRNSFHPITPTPDILRELQAHAGDAPDFAEPLMSEDALDEHTSSELLGGGDHSDDELDAIQISNTSENSDDELDAIQVSNTSETIADSPTPPEPNPNLATTTPSAVPHPLSSIPPLPATIDAPSGLDPGTSSSQPQIVTRTGRISKPARRLVETHMLHASTSPDTHGANIAVAGTKSDGNFTIKQAMALDEAKARKALKAELRQMLDLNVIGRKTKLNDKPLPSKMFLKWKTIQGTLEFKARLVIGGHMQDKASMGETYSPTVNPESTNLLLVMAARSHRKPFTVDVSGAFLHVPLKGTTLHMRLSKEVASLLVEMDPNFTHDLAEDGSIIVRIQKAIYGLGESSRQWHEHLADTLTKLGYRRAQYDRCVFTRRDGGGRLASMLAIHVDDILAVDLGQSSDKNVLIEGLTKAYGKVTVNDGSSLVYLGVTIDCLPGSFQLHQRELIQTVDYPTQAKLPKNPASPDILQPPASSMALDPAKFRSTLMRVLYIATKTRFDLLFAINVLASRQQLCTQADERALAQLVGFLKGTAHWTLNIAPKNETLLCWADASYACHRDGRGHSGIVCSIGGAPIYARSVKQKIVSKSSTEAELLALNNAADEVTYLRNLLEELGMRQHGPTEIKQDNNSAIIMAERGELGTKRTKHFTVRHYFVSQLLKGGIIKLTHQPGGQMLADGLTKPLTGPFGRAWARRLLGMAEEVNHAEHCAVQGTLLEGPATLVGVRQVPTRHAKSSFAHKQGFPSRATQGITRARGPSPTEVDCHGLRRA